MHSPLNLWVVVILGLCQLPQPRVDAAWSDYIPSFSGMYNKVSEAVSTTTAAVKTTAASIGLSDPDKDFKDEITGALEKTFEDFTAPSEFQVANKLATLSHVHIKEFKVDTFNYTFEDKDAFSFSVKAASFAFGGHYAVKKLVTLLKGEFALLSESSSFSFQSKLVGDADNVADKFSLNQNATKCTADLGKVKFPDPKSSGFFGLGFVVNRIKFLTGKVKDSLKSLAKEAMCKQLIEEVSDSLSVPMAQTAMSLLLAAKRKAKAADKTSNNGKEDDINRLESK